MREDMSKVLVESMRTGRSWASAHEGSRRKYRNRADRDGEGAVQRLGIRRDVRVRKHFGEHLGPLYRYLRQQVDRPWSKVYGELCAAMDKRNVVQAHLFQHIEDRVAVETFLQDGQVFVRRDWRGPVALADSRVELYVHPVTGILLRNRAGERTRQQRNQDKARQAKAVHPDRRSGLKGMPPDCQWHRVEGIWYEVRLAEFGTQERVYDVLLRRVLASATDAGLRQRTYGCCRRYACAKRQLGHAELAAHGLSCA